jgi:hypothetical protein
VPAGYHSAPAVYHTDPAASVAALAAVDVANAAVVAAYVVFASVGLVSAAAAFVVAPASIVEIPAPLPLNKQGSYPSVFLCSLLDGSRIVLLTCRLLQCLCLQHVQPDAVTNYRLTQSEAQII